MPTTLEEYPISQPKGTPGNRPKSLHERIDDFWRYVKKDPNHPKKCWEWSKSLTTYGYGQFNINGCMWATHRLSYVIAHKIIPDGMCVCHKCDNAKCVNPDHLFLGTKNDNMQDMIQKGRAFHPTGENAPMPKLSAQHVAEIRALYKMGFARKATLARAYGIGRSAVGQLLLGRAWPDVFPCPEDDPCVIIMKRRIESGEFLTDRPSQKGEKHSQSKLTEDAVRIIRREYSRGEVKRLANEFGIAVGTVRDIYNRRRWSHVH